MDNENLTANHPPSISQRLLAAVVPVLLISIGYVDPGKWAAAVEGGPHFGFDLIAVVLAFNFAAVLCQYLSATIAVVTGRNLAQICSEEYDIGTRICLGVLTELSMIALDLTMILGTAHCLNLLLGVDLFSCVFLTAIDALLFPVFAALLDNGRAKFLCTWTASFILLFYVFGVLFSHQEATTFPLNGTLTKLTGESVFALMSLLGANIMPHNFYLHSSIVQQDRVLANASKELLCHDHFFAIVCIFSGIFLVNCMLMNSAANVFFSTDLVISTIQDALSLMDQAFRSSMAPFAFLMILFLSNQITALTWNLGRQAVLWEFFRMDIPGWLHHATIRIVALIPALYCVWSSGDEGMYQLLIFTQVVVALVLPSSVIPLFRVASSRAIMGIHKISQSVEFLVLVMFIGLLGLKIIFLVEMIFGNSDWVGNLRWNSGSNACASYTVLFIIACASLCLMLWLAATPLKSASSRLEPQVWDLDTKHSISDSNVQSRKCEFSEGRYNKEECIQKQDPMLAVGNSLESHSDVSMTSNDLNLPERLLDNGNMPCLTTIEENSSSIAFPTSSLFHPEESNTTVETVLSSSTCNDSSVVESLLNNALKIDPTYLVEKTVRIEGDSHNGKDEEEEPWEPEETIKGLPANNQSSASEGPGSYRSLSGKSDESGSGAGSLSRLAGLGRAARRQLTLILDEFWGQLFDFHGQATQEAKTKKFDVLLGIDSKADPSSTAPSLKMDNSVSEFSGYMPSGGGKGSESLKNLGAYNSGKLGGLQGHIESTYGVQRGSSALWSSRAQLLDAYLQNSSHSALDSGERRYSSLRLSPSFDSNDHQPATVHGYQIAYFSRIAKERGPDYLHGQMDAQTRKLPSLAISHSRDPLALASGRKAPSGLSSMAPPGFSTPLVSRNTQLKAERPFKDLCSPAPAENLDTAVNAKKFHSLPDISGLSLPYRTAYLSDRNGQQDSYVGYGSSLYSGTSIKGGAPLAFEDLSPSKPVREPFSLQLSSSADTGSLWSRQPFEQFAVADRTHCIVGEGGGSGQSSLSQETTSIMGMESKLLQSFRHCIVKLLKLEGSDWLFRQNDGADEDLIDRVAARERFLFEAETREMNRVVHVVDARYTFDQKQGSSTKDDGIDHTKLLVSSVPNCREGCVWKVDLIISFGVWCIHRILELSLMESRPELWGKYTFVLNRLQGIINLAFSVPRAPMTPCFCLQIPVHQQRSSPPISNGSLPPPVKLGRGKGTTAAMLLDMIKDVEIAISCRKGRSGTAAGDVAFPKGKENLASVLKRYKRRLSNKPVGSLDSGSSSLRAPVSGPYGL